MEKSWHRNMFSFRRKPASEIVPPPADPEDAEVQFNQGFKFASGMGAAQDFVQAAAWYHKAAAQSHSLAQFNLGTMYAQGQGVVRDDVISLMWFGQAAQLGDAGAQYNLGERCHRASFKQAAADAAESRIEAYKWYRLAAAQGYQNSETAYTTLTLNMTRPDVTAGIERFAAFVVGKSKPPQA
jgi:TPR repeat protein